MVDYMNYVMLGLKGVTVVVFTFIFLGIALYYLLVIRMRKSWSVKILEMKADGNHHIVDTDKIISQKINKGKTTIYKLVKFKQEVIPPPWECTYKFGNKEYCDYLRVDRDYIPLKQEFTKPSIDFANKDKKKTIGIIDNMLHDIRNNSTEYTQNKYMYIPIKKTVCMKMDYTAIDYDVDMMRINMIDNLETQFKDNGDFLTKYGQLIGFGMVAIMLIVCLYMSFEYASGVIEQMMGAADKVAGPLGDIASRLSGGNPAS